MRRFQDGSIREAVVWQPANTFEDKRKGFAQMIKDILNRYFQDIYSSLILISCL